MQGTRSQKGSLFHNRCTSSSPTIESHCLLPHHQFIEVPIRSDVSHSPALAPLFCCSASITNPTRQPVFLVACVRLVFERDRKLNLEYKYVQYILWNTDRVYTIIASSDRVETPHTLSCCPLSNSTHK